MEEQSISALAEMLKGCKLNSMYSLLAQRQPVWQVSVLFHLAAPVLVLYDKA